MVNRTRTIIEWLWNIINMYGTCSFILLSVVFLQINKNALIFYLTKCVVSFKISPWLGAVGTLPLDFNLKTINHPESWIKIINPLTIQIFFDRQISNRWKKWKTTNFESIGVSVSIFRRPFTTPIHYIPCLVLCRRNYNLNDLSHWSTNATSLLVLSVEL